MKYYGGVDLHKKCSVITIKDEKGSPVAQESLDNANREEMLSFLLGYQNLSLVAEATFNWAWFSDMCEEHMIPLVLANPQRTKAISSAKVKTDKIDSGILADLLRANLVPESYRFNQDQRFLKEILGHRITFVRYQTSLKNNIHAILHKHNLQHCYSDLFGKDGREYLSKLELPRLHRLMVERYLATLDTVQLEIDKAQIQAKRGFEKQGKTREINLLKTIPGVGSIVAMTILAEVGDIKRFPNAKALCRYSGLVPSVYQSGSTKRTGEITKQGSKYLRWVLIQAAHRSVLKTGHLRNFYLRLKKRRDKKKAKVAVARKILVAAYHILTDMEEFKNPKELT